MTPHKLLRRRLVILALTTGVTLAACGGGDSAPADTLPACVGLTVTAVPSIRWDAADYTATAGEISTRAGAPMPGVEAQPITLDATHASTSRSEARIMRES